VLGLEIIEIIKVNLWGQYGTRGWMALYPQGPFTNRAPRHTEKPGSAYTLQPPLNAGFAVKFIVCWKFAEKNWARHYLL